MSWLLIMLIIAAVVLFGLGFVVEWLFWIALVLFIAWIITLLARLIRREAKSRTIPVVPVTTMVVTLVMVSIAVVPAGCGSEVTSSTTALPSSTTAASVTSSTIPPSSTTIANGGSSTTSMPTCSASGLDVEVLPQQDLPPEIARMREAMFNAAMSCDFAALEELAQRGTAGFTFTFGGGAGGPAAYWQSQEVAGESVLATFVTILNMPHGRVESQYVWPFAHALDFRDLSDDQIQLLRQYFTEEDIADWQRFGSYTGYRVGINEAGEWLYFVAGD